MRSLLYAIFLLSIAACAGLSRDLSTAKVSGVRNLAGANCRDTVMSKKLIEARGKGLVNSRSYLISSRDLVGKDAVPAYVFQLTIVVFNGSGWNDQNILSQLSKTARIYASCKIGFDVKVIYTDSPTGSVDFGGQRYDDGMGDYENSIGFAAQALEKWIAKPTVFLVRTPGGGYGYHSEEFQCMPYVQNTAWIGSSVLTMSTDSQDEGYRDPNYSTIAHELGHIFDLGHDDRPGNVMSYPYRIGSPRFDDRPFTNTFWYKYREDPYAGKSQCERLYEQDLIRKI